VLFYSGCLVDEVWIRSTARACLGLGLRIALGVGETFRPEYQRVRDACESAGIAIVFENGRDRPRELIARLVVTASTGLKRSDFHPLTERLIHMPHSLASLHMIYPADCFDGYDVLFASGQHHVLEFAALRSHRGRPSGEVFPIGYGKLDLLFAARGSNHGQTSRPSVLLAPSWGQENVLDYCGEALIDALLRKVDVVVRPHPAFFLGHSPVLRRLADRFGDRIRIEDATVEDGAIHTSDLLITDYSGIAFEFHVLRRRPVLFVDVAKKVLNVDWPVYQLPPVELEMRRALGLVARPDAAEIVRQASSLLRCEQTRDAPGPYKVADLVFNPARCGVVAAAKLKDLLP
jgi:hypothetical protein